MNTPRLGWVILATLKILLIAFSFSAFSHISHASFIGNAIPQTDSTTSLNQGLVGWWTFDSKDMKNNVVDRSGSGNTGYLQGFGATSTAVVAGKMGQAVKFNGTSNRIITSSDPIGLGEMTLSLWIYPRVRDSSNHSLISNNRTVILISNSASNLYRFYSDGGSSSLNSSSGKVVLNKWTHIAVTRTATGYSTFYFNGVADTSGTKATTTGITTFTIGSAAGLSNYFPGSLDDVRVYSRALSASEIKQLYDQGAGSKVNAIPQTDSTTSLNQGLVGWWTFDSKDMKNNVVDRSGSGNTGYLQGFGATSTAVVAGKMGQGLKFDGGSNYVSVGSLSSAPTNQGTVSFWLYYKSSTNSDGFFSSKETDGSSSILVYDSSGSMRFFKYDNAGTATVDATATSIPLNRWTHYIFTWNGVNTAYIYKNGVQVGSDSTIASSPDGAINNVWIGNDRATASRTISGVLDDVRVYSRALSASEIKQLYDQGAGSKINAMPQTDSTTSLNQGLVGWWTFDSKDIKNNVKDRSVSGNNGNMQGFTSTSSAVVAGKMGQGLKFDATNDYINIGNTNTYNFTSDNFSFSAWVKPSALSGSSGKTLFSRGLYQTDGYYIQFSSASGKTVISLSCNQSGNQIESARQVVSANKTNLATGKWMHVVVVRSGTLGRIYVNGAEETYSAQQSLTDPTTSTRNFYIGKYDSASGYYGGSIDEVRVYNRALSESEIKQLYNMGR